MFLKIYILLLDIESQLDTAHGGRSDKNVW